MHLLERLGNLILVQVVLYVRYIISLVYFLAPKCCQSSAVHCSSSSSSL